MSSLVDLIKNNELMEIGWGGGGDGVQLASAAVPGSSLEFSTVTKYCT